MDSEGEELARFLQICYQCTEKQLQQQQLRSQRAHVGQIVEHCGVFVCVCSLSGSKWPAVAGLVGPAMSSVPGGHRLLTWWAAPCCDAPFCPCYKGLAPDLQMHEGGESWVLNLYMPQVPCMDNNVYFWQMMPPFGEELLRSIPPLPIEYLESLNFEALLVLIQSQWKNLHYI